MFTNIVIVVVLAVVILAGLRGSFKHLRGEGSCCGGESTVKPKKVSYKRKHAHLKMERQVSDEEIKKAVEHAGYKVVA